MMVYFGKPLRCPECQSSRIRPVHVGRIDHVTSPQPIRCEACGEIADQGAVFPELDALEDFESYFAEAPTGEPPADVIVWEPGQVPARRPPQRTVSRAAVQLPALSPRESEVARLVAAGRSNKEIAAELGICVETVKQHVANACRRMNAPNRTVLAVSLILAGHELEGMEVRRVC